MEIQPLPDEHRQLYLWCLEDWSEEVTKEAGPRKEFWYEKMKARGLRVLIAKDDRGEVGGMIHYAPIEHSVVLGEGLYFIYCIWVHGHKEGRGDFRGHGMGRALLQAAEKDARDLGAKGMAAWGLWLPFWMRASWFRKQGYVKAERHGITTLVWKPFVDGATPPRWLKNERKPEPVPGKVTVTAFVNGWCTAGNIVYERAKRAAAEFRDKVFFRDIDTLDRQTMLEWGQADALFIDDRQVRTGPPPSYQKILGLIARSVKKL